MGRIHFLSILLLAQLTMISAVGEFKRMPDTRGQSFGLENFLLQPFSLVSQGDQNRREQGHTPVPYEFKVQNEPFDMMKVVPTLPGASLLFDQETLQDEVRPVHEYPELRPPPPQRNRQNNGQEPIRRRLIPPPTDTRRPLEPPTEFHLSLTENAPVEPIEVSRPERYRKRVMKRRRKKPQPETADDTLIEEIESILGQQSDVQVNYNQKPLFSDSVDNIPQRKKLEHNRHSGPQKTSPNFEHKDDDQEDRLQTQASQRSPQKELRPKEKGQNFLLRNDGQREPEKQSVNTEHFPALANLPIHYDSQGIGQFSNSHEQVRLEGGFLPLRNVDPSSKLHKQKPTVSNQPLRNYKEKQQEQATRNEKPSQPKEITEEDSEEYEENYPKVENYPPRPQLLNKDGNNNSDRKPERVFEEDDPEVKATESPSQSTERLKTLLKQSNGQLSLSELLQTQNLSLADFLKGNPGALSALGGTKVNSEKNSSQTEVQSTQHIPKISPKSRPFSKPLNNTKPARRTNQKSTSTTTTTTTTESTRNLPKKLQIIEVTSAKPSYNGFAPKNPRGRGSYKPEHRFTKEKTEEVNEVKTTLDKVKEQDTAESENLQENASDEVKKESEKPARLPVYRISTSTPQPIEYTIGEQRLVPKRYGDYKSKVRLDRRKPSDASTEGTTISESQETTTKSTTEEAKASKESRNRVRIPFMSANNPDISVIIPSKKNSTTEKPKERTRERFHLFKRPNSEEKQTDENLLEEKEKQTEVITSTTSTQATIIKTTSTEYVREPQATESVFDENSDEIIELLKMGNNAARLKQILAARNMTVEELLEKRANISKQPNVTHLFHKERPPQLSENQKVSELTDNFHPTTEKPYLKHSKIDAAHVQQERAKMKSHVTNTFEELYVDESVVRPIKIPYEQDEKREPKSYEKNIKEEPKIPQKTVQRLNLSPGVEGKPKYPVPLWNVDQQTIYSPNPYGYPSYDLNKNLAGQTTESPKIQEVEIISLETIKRNQDLNSRLRDNINNILKEQQEVVKEVKEDVTFIPPAVKSAIIASGVVMGIAVVVFVAIFAACGWKQRQFRLRARSSILNDSLNGSTHKKRSGTLSPVSFQKAALYKKSIDFEDTDSSVSGSSNTSSYLWNTLKHTFQSRNSTLKNRQEKEEKIQERENRSRRNTLSREDDRVRKNNMMSHDEIRDSFVNRDLDFPRRNTLGRDEMRRDSIMSRDTLSRDLTRESIISRDFRESMPRDLARQDSRRSSCYRDDTRRISSLLRENDRCSFKKIDPERHIIQTSVNFKRGGYNASGRNFDNCDHFN